MNGLASMRAIDWRTVAVIAAGIASLVLGVLRTKPGAAEAPAEPDREHLRAA